MKSVFFPGKIFLSVFALFLLQGCDIFASSDQKEVSFINRNLVKEDDLRKESMNFEIARFEKFNAKRKVSWMILGFCRSLSNPSLLCDEDYASKEDKIAISKACQSKFYKRYRFLHYVSSPKVLNAPDLDEGINKLIREFKVLNTRNISIPVENVGNPENMPDISYNADCLGTEYLLSGNYIDHDKCSVPSQEFAKKWSDYNINERGYSEGKFPVLRIPNRPIDIDFYFSREDDFDYVTVSQNGRRSFGHSVNLVPMRLLQDEISDQCFLVQVSNKPAYKLYSKTELISNKSDTLIRKHFIEGNVDYFQNPWEPEDY